MKGCVFPRLVWVRILDVCSIPTFCKLRGLSSAMRDLSKMAQSQWYRLLWRHGKRRIGENSEHRTDRVPHEICVMQHLNEGTRCMQVAHYLPWTLELKLLKTIPLHQQFFRLMARRELRGFRRELKRASREWAGLYDSAHQRFEIAMEWQREVERAEQRLAKYGGQRRKRFKIDL